MNLKKLGWNWEQFAKTDPMWAILSVPERKGGKWDPEEFFATGRRAVAQLLDQVRSHGLPVRGRALDFGCGIGRLTQALCEHVEEAVGVDISPSMIEQAQKHNRFAARCSYYVNEASDLRLFPDDHFDLVMTIIVLQHMRPEYSKGYLLEFLRVLKPGGVLIFQLPAESVDPSDVPAIAQPRNALRRLLRSVRSSWTPAVVERPKIEMYGVSKQEVVDLLKSAGGRLVDVQPDGLAGPQWIGYHYIVEKLAKAV